MDDALRQALKGEHEEKPFHGASVRIRHMSAAERLKLVGEYSEIVDSAKAFQFYHELIVSCVGGVDESDADELMHASYPRFEELAQLVLNVNGMGNDQAEQIAKN